MSWDYFFWYANTYLNSRKYQEILYQCVIQLWVYECKINWNWLVEIWRFFFLLSTYFFPFLSLHYKTCQSNLPCTFEKIGISLKMAELLAFKRFHFKKKPVWIWVRYNCLIFYLKLYHVRIIYLWERNLVSVNFCLNVFV